MTFLGNGSDDQPTITGNDTASVTGADGKPLGTLKSATVAVDANYFVAINMKFEVKRFFFATIELSCPIKSKKKVSLEH